MSVFVENHPLKLFSFALQAAEQVRLFEEHFELEVRTIFLGLPELEFDVFGVGSEI